MNKMLKGKVTLILDDSRAMRETLRIHLSNLEITTVRPVGRVADAMREIENRKFDIILCDYHLSDGRNGQQFLEELRARHLISHSCVFIMVTAEQAYHSVIAVAEYAPDDYLIKPFVSSSLEKRIVAAFDKKHALRKIYAAMDNRDYAKAFDACEAYLAEGSSKYRKYVERLRAECCLNMENYHYAAQLFEEILEKRPVAWAELGLGKALHHIGEFERSTDLLKHVCQHHPEYLECYDSLAKAHEAAGEDQAAEEVVGKAIEKSPLRLDRRAHLGEIALRTGNLEKAEEAFAKIVNDGVGSCYHAPDAYFRLSEIYTAKGDTEKAGELIRKLNDHFDAEPDVAFCATMTELAVAKKKEEQDQVKALFAEAKRILVENPSLELPESIRLRYACEALDLGDDDGATEILRQIFQNNKRPDAIKKTARSYMMTTEGMARLNLLFDEFDQEIEVLNEKSQELARQQKWDEAVNLASEAVNRLPNNIEVLLSAAQINLMRMERKGWDQFRFPTVRKYLEKAREISPKHPKLPALDMMVERTKKKFGIKSDRKISYRPDNKSARPAAKPAGKAAGGAAKAKPVDDDDDIDLSDLL